MAVCPICQRHPSEPKYQPFCSSRCADVDLGRWFTGAYVIPVREDEPTDDQGGPGGSPDRSWRED